MRTLRKPVPQLSICKDCGNDFKYMRTLGPRKYCDVCADGVAKAIRLKKFKMIVDIPVEADTV